MARKIGYALLNDGDYVDVRLSADDLARMRHVFVALRTSQGLLPQESALYDQLADIEREFFREFEER